VATARQRLAGLKSITPAPNFGPGLTVAGFEAKATGVDTMLSEYNQKVAELDDLGNALDAAESELSDLNGRVLSATKAQYGPDSSEYEMVGGTRRSERKRPVRKGGGGSGSPKP
jgi:hypothetical protein